MVHERQFDKDIKLSGPLTSCAAVVRAKLHEIETSILIQNEGFEHLIKGSRITMEEVLNRAPNNWYIEAQEALSLGLIQAVI